jgi:hypothetical protein
MKKVLKILKKKIWKRKKKGKEKKKRKKVKVIIKTYNK